MTLQQWWMILAAEFVCSCLSSQFSLPKRKCVFHLNQTANRQQNNKYLLAGNVSGFEQVCENTDCCVGYFLVVNGQPVVDLLACDVAEKSCPDATCMTQSRFNGSVIKCVCKTDLCNSNITWTPDSEIPEQTHSYFGDTTMKVAVIVIATVFILFFIVAAPKWRRLIKHKKNLQACPPDCTVSTLCSCKTTKTSELDIADIELQHILGRGYFTTVWRGRYQGSTVAVKVFPACWKHKFTAEKEVYELPLMKHAGIAHFLGTASKQDDSSCLIVLQLAEYGSLSSFLSQHTTNWMQSLRLCLSLSQGLSYLHSDLHRYDVHKPPVAHSDLSSANVLVKADGTCALSDFGCSTILHSCSVPHSWQSPQVKGFIQTGTLRYMAPEILEGSVSLSSWWCLMHGDVYALSLLLWEIWMRCADLFEGSVAPQHLLPYESELGGDVTLSSLITYVFNMDKRPSIPIYWELLPQGSAMLELLTECWDFDPEARLTAHCVVDRLVSLLSPFSS